MFVCIAALALVYRLAVSHLPLFTCVCVGGEIEIGRVLGGAEAPFQDERRRAE